MDLKVKIKEFAKEIGVDLIGFTTADTFEDVREILEKRKELQYFSGFEEAEIELRVNPRRTLNDAKSIIVIGQSYFVDESLVSLDKNNKPVYYGELARTAWGRDYHIVLHEKLNNIAKMLEKEVVNFQYKAFVDTGPLVDRHVAYRAGLGWYGYNSTIINEEYGSWFFIGYMITNVDIQPDKPLENKSCFGCNLCIKNCPSDAIEEPYLFNANKCLSCLLQKKTDIPETERAKLGKRLYGCDVCQTICPHNKNIKKSTTKEFIPVDSSHKVDLVKLLSMSNKEYKEVFGGNASGWRGKKVMQRNAIIALVNEGKADAVKYLIPLLKDERQEIREYAKWGIGVLNPQLAKEVKNKE